MLPINIEKQRKCPPFLKLCLGDQTKQTKIYYRIVHFYYFKCFRLVLKSKGNARLFSNFVWRTDGRGAGGRRGQTCQTEIYYRIVYFYCFKCFGLILKSKGNASLFSNVVWQRKCPQFLKLCLADGYADATYLRSVLKSKGNARHFFFKVFLAYGWAGYGRRGAQCDPQLVFC